MIWDELSLFVLKNILKEKQTTTWSIAKSFSWMDKPDKFILRDSDNFYKKKDALICRRLKIMSRDGLVKIKKQSDSYKRKVYIVDCNRVIYQKKHKFPGCFSEALLIKEKSGWIILQL